MTDHHHGSLVMRVHRGICRLHPGHGCRRGQVATYFIVWIAILVLLTVVVMNVGQIAMVRTTTANAADSAALSLASMLGATARQQCAQLDSSGQCQTQCSDHGEFVLKVSLEVLKIVIGALLCLTVVLCAVGIALIISGIAGIIVIAIQVGAIMPHQIGRFNERMEELSDHNQMRESTFLGALIQLVDDPRQEPDIVPGVPLDSDIDRDGDTTEMVGVFAKWWNRRLVQLEDHMQRARRAIESLVMVSLMVFRQQSHEFRGWLDTDFKSTLSWLKGVGYPVAWWQPGLQLPNSDTYFTNRTPPCMPGTPGCPARTPQLPDDVDWMIGDCPLALCGPSRIDPVAGRSMPGSPKEFETWILSLVKCQTTSCVGMYYDPNAYKIRRRTVRKLWTWKPLLENYWRNQLEFWRSLVVKWVGDLTDIRARMCLQFVPSCLPPGHPGPHPIDGVIAKLQEFVGRIDGVIAGIDVFQPKKVSLNHPIYRWHDDRGWHYVRVDLSDFTVAHPEAAQNIVLGTEDLVCGLTVGCLENCVGIEAREGFVGAKVTRFDQDRGINRGWAFRARNVPDPARTHEDFNFDRDPNFDASSLDPFTGVVENNFNYVNRMLDKYGIISRSKAHYSWRPNSVRLSEVQ